MPGSHYQRLHVCHWLLVWLAACVVAPIHAREMSALKRYDFDDATHFLTEARNYGPWADLLARQQQDQVALDRCVTEDAASVEQGEAQCPGRWRGYGHLMRNARGLSADQKLSLVNLFVNRRHWRVERRTADDWRTLADFLSRGGDCEDFAAAKYFMLRQLGFAANDLRVVVVRMRSSADYHAVLMVRKHDADGTTIRELDVDGSRGAYNRGYEILFALNEEGIWDHTRSFARLRERQNQTSETPALRSEESI